MHERIRDALLDIAEHGREAMTILEGKDIDTLGDDAILRRALERLLEIMGEAAARVPDFVRRDLDIPWTRMVGLRNVLAHAYDLIDLPRLVETVQTDVPDVVRRVEEFLRAEAE